MWYKLIWSGPDTDIGLSPVSFVVFMENLALLDLATLRHPDSSLLPLHILHEQVYGSLGSSSHLVHIRSWTLTLGVTAWCCSWNHRQEAGSIDCAVCLLDPCLYLECHNWLHEHIARWWVSTGSLGLTFRKRVLMARWSATQVQWTSLLRHVYDIFTSQRALPISSSWKWRLNRNLFLGLLCFSLVCICLVVLGFWRLDIVMVQILIDLSLRFALTYYFPQIKFFIAYCSILWLI